MKSTIYHIESLDLSVEPETDDIKPVSVIVDLESTAYPEYKNNGLHSEFSMTMELFERDYVPNEDSNAEEHKLGEIEVDFLAAIEGDMEEFEEYINIWEDGGYTSLPQEFRARLESGVITEIIAPISNLINNSFRGVLPQLLFSESGEEPEELELEKETKEALEKGLSSLSEETTGEDDQLERLSVMTESGKNYVLDLSEALSEEDKGN